MVAQVAISTNKIVDIDWGHLQALQSNLLGGWNLSIGHGIEDILQFNCRNTNRVERDVNVWLFLPEFWSKLCNFPIRDDNCSAPTFSSEDWWEEKFDHARLRNIASFSPLSPPGGETGDQVWQPGMFPAVRCGGGLPVLLHPPVLSRYSAQI